MSDGYNGWTNYETWAVRLYMDNDAGQARYWEQAAKDAYANAQPPEYLTRSEMAAIDLADHIMETHEEAAEELLGGSIYEHGPLADLLRGAIGDVNWREIAANWIEAYCKEEAHADG